MIESFQPRERFYMMAHSFIFASVQVLELLMGEQRLMARLASVKHYFLLDQARRHLGEYLGEFTGTKSPK